MNDSPSLIAQLEHAALIGGFERTLLRDASARIAELEAQVKRLDQEAERHALQYRELEDERDAYQNTADEEANERDKQVMLRKAAEDEQDRLKAALTEIAYLGGKTLIGADWRGPERSHEAGAAKAFDQTAEIARAALSGEDYPSS